MTVSTAIGILRIEQDLVTESTNSIDERRYMKILLDRSRHTVSNEQTARLDPPS